MTHEDLRSKAAQALASIECKTQAPCTADPERCECWTQARAVLAVVYAEAMTWPTLKMQCRYASEGGDVENSECDWRAMVDASPLKAGQ